LAEAEPKVEYLHEVTPAMADAYAANIWADKVTARTFNAHVMFLRKMFGDVSTLAGLTQNVWSGVGRQELATESRRELTPAELRKVCGSAQGMLRYMFALGLYTGMRLGDVCLLKWDGVDFSKKCINYTPMKTSRKGRQVRVPIHPVLEAMLVELKQQREKGSEYLLPEAAELYQRDPQQMSKQIKALFEANKIKTTEPGPEGRRMNAIVRVGFHSLRHSFVSLCAAKRVPEVAIMELVGHGSPAMTRLYSHAGDEQKVKAVAALPAIAFPGRRTART